MGTILDNVLLDVNYSADASGGPEWATAIVRSGEGGTVAHRNENREDYVSRYDVQFGALSKARKDALRAFFINRRGMARAFRFLAPDDSEILDHWLGTRVAGTTDITNCFSTDGATAEFFTIKSYSDAGNNYLRWITHISPINDLRLKICEAGNTANVLAEGTFAGGFLYNPFPVFPASKTINLAGYGNATLFYNAGRIVFETPLPANVIPLVTGIFHLPVCFASDLARFQIDEATISEITVSLEEILPVEFGLSPEIPASLDTTPPEVSLDEPAQSTAYGTIQITGAASDNLSLLDTRLFINGSPYGTAQAGTDLDFTVVTSDVPNGTKQIHAEARDTAGNIGTSNTITLEFVNPPADAAAPVISQFTAQPAGSTTINLSAAFSDNVGVTGVDLEWSASGANLQAAPGTGGWTTLRSNAAPTTATTHNFSDATAQPGTTRHYRFRCRDFAQNVSGWVTAFATPPSAPDTEPPVMTGLTATAVSATQINIAYLASDNVAVTGYDLQWSANGSTGWTPLLTNSNAASPFQHTGLTPGTEYFYRARARDAAGNVTPTWATANATTVAPPVLQPLTLIPGDNQITVNFSFSDTDGTVTKVYLETSPTGANQNSPYNDQSDDWTVRVPGTAPATATTHSYTLTGLGQGETVHFRAWVEDDDGAISNPRRFANAPTNPPPGSGNTLTFDGEVLLFGNDEIRF